MTERRRAATAVVAAIAVALLWLAGGQLPSGAQTCDILNPCTTTTAAPTTTEPPTTAAPPTTATPSTTSPPRTTARPAATTAPPTTARQATPTTARTTSTAAPTTTAPSLLVPGPATSEPTQATTIDGTKVASVANKDDTGQVVALVIAGLLTVALLLGLLTFRFWRNTRPVPVEDGGPRRRAATVGARG